MAPERKPGICMTFRLTSGRKPIPGAFCWQWRHEPSQPLPSPPPHGPHTPGARAGGPQTLPHAVLSSYQEDSSVAPLPETLQRRQCLQDKVQLSQPSGLISPHSPSPPHSLAAAQPSSASLPALSLGTYGSGNEVTSINCISKCKVFHEKLEKVLRAREVQEGFLEEVIL